jgi:hypothetical protein
MAAVLGSSAALRWLLAAVEAVDALPKWAHLGFELDPDPFDLLVQIV